MVYHYYQGKVHLVPSLTEDDPTQWPLAKLPLADLEISDWEIFTERVQEQVGNTYHGKNEGTVSKQEVLGSMQRILVVFLNSLME